MKQKTATNQPVGQQVKNGQNKKLEVSKMLNKKKLNELELPVLQKIVKLYENELGLTFNGKTRTDYVNFIMKWKKELFKRVANANELIQAILDIKEAEKTIEKPTQESSKKPKTDKTANKDLDELEKMVEFKIGIELPKENPEPLTVKSFNNLDINYYPMFVKKPEGYEFTGWYDCNTPSGRHYPIREGYVVVPTKDIVDKLGLGDKEVYDYRFDTITTKELLWISAEKKVDLGGGAYDTKDNDEIDLSIVIRNGYNGGNGLRFHVGWIREICSNGMVIRKIAKSFEKIHRGQESIDVINEVMDEVERVVYILKLAKEYKIEKEQVDEIIEKLQKKISKTYAQAVINEIEKAKKKKKEITAWDLHNMITYPAYHKDEYEGKTEVKTWKLEELFDIAEEPLAIVAENENK